MKNKELNDELKQDQRKTRERPATLHRKSKRWREILKNYVMN